MSSPVVNRRRCVSLWEGSRTGTTASHKGVAAHERRRYVGQTEDRLNQEPDPDPSSVHDETSFLAFVAELARDKVRASKMNAVESDAPRGWQNQTIAAFLESAVAWAEDSNFGRRQGLPDDASPWRRFAVFLYCGKIYE